MRQSNIYQKEIKVYTHGVFDLLHYGHIRFLEKAKSLGDMLIVGLITDENVKQVKGKLVMTYDERWEVLKSIKCINMIVSQNSLDPTENFKILEDTMWFPDILARASDVKEPVPGQEYIESKGGKVAIVDYTEGISSSIIKERIINADR